MQHKTTDEERVSERIFGLHKRQADHDNEVFVFEGNSFSPRNSVDCIDLDRRWPHL